MTHTLRAALAVAALLGLSQLAHAGPLRWGYRAEAPDGTVLSERTGLTDLVWSDYFLPDPRTHGVPVPDPFPDNDLRTDTLRSEATVTVVDETSGQSGTAWLYTDYRWQYERRADGTWDPYYEGQTGGPWPERTNLVLGGNTFAVGGPGGEFSVEVMPGPVAATPEPGTLALAALGLVGVVARRLRRRPATRPAVVAALVCLGVFGPGQSASAGPIEWSMRGDVDHSRLGSELYLGEYIRWLPDDRREEIVHVYGTLPEGLLPVGAGSQDYIKLGAQSKQAYRYGSAPPPDPEASRQVAFSVWVTDAASGETGHLSFPLTAYYLTGLPSTEYGEMVFSGGGGGPLLLGGNKYEVRLNTSDGDEGTYVSANLTVAPVAATPEPGTLALAALGLSALGVVRRRRRRTS